MFLTELLERQKENDKKAIKYGNNEITFKDWYNHSLILSKTINRIIIENESNVALFLPNSINYAVAYFSVLFSKKIIIPIGTQSKGIEIRSAVKYCEIDLIVTSLMHREYLKECLKSYNHKVMLLIIEDQSIETINGDNEIISKSDAIINIGTENDVAIMLHTSGTTSNPKRVMLTHNNLIKNIESNIQSLKLTKDDKVLISMPMYFGYCNTAQFLTHLYLGASMVILDSMFLPKIFFETVQDERITNYTGVPSTLLMLLDYRYVENYDISSLRYICFGGGKMPVEKLEELIKRLNTVGFVQTYGQTEASPRTTALLPNDQLRKIGSVGLPIPNVKIQVIDEDGNKLFANEIGEIVIQGNNVMKGYYKQEKITSETIIDGWLHSGDLGYIDSEGYLYLSGRKRNMIISGGINIYPEEIEELLMQHPNVSDVCVLAEEHKLLGEVPIAKVVLKNSICYLNDFKDYCFSRLAYYKVPVRFDFVAELDKTYNGKIKRY